MQEHIFIVIIVFFSSGENPRVLAQHMALNHGGLDNLLADPSVVEMKRQENANYNAMNRGPQKVADQQCPICDQNYTKKEIREHCARHFAEEITAILDSFPDPTVCSICNGAYASKKKNGMHRHIALGHGKMDGFLQDAQLVAAKRQQVAENGLDRFRGPMVR